MVVEVYHPNHDDQTLERIRWDAQLPFLNVNFFLYQLSRENQNREWMIDWTQMSSTDKIPDTVSSKFMSLFKTLLSFAQQASHLTSQYAGEFVHVEYNKVLKLKKLCSGYFGIEQIDPYASSEVFKKYIDQLVELESEQIIFKIRNNLGRTLLHEAFKRLEVDLETFKRMVILSGDINATDINGYNILMTAQQQRRNQSLIELMIQFGAKPMTISDSTYNCLGFNESQAKKEVCILSK